MSVQVYIPTPFRRATKNADRVAVEAPDVKGLLDELEDQFGGLRGLVRNDQGEVRFLSEEEKGQSPMGYLAAQ